MRTRLAALASAGALVLLTGCGSDLAPEAHPGSAAVVGDETISIEEVDELSSEICGFYSQVSGGMGSLGLVRTQVLSTRVSELKARAYAEEFDLNPTPHVRAQLKQFESDLQKSQLSAAQKDTMHEFVEPSMYAEAVYIAAGADETANQLTQDGELSPAEMQQAREKGNQEVLDWAERLDVQTDPRFAELAEDGVNLDPAPLSVAEDNPEGKAVSAQELQTEFADLPKSQQCQ